ncbi:MAG: hypothetical protein AAFR17_05075 [Pseudomonadota bacterium]
MADPTYLATCVQALDYASLYIGYHDGYDETYEALLDQAEVNFSNRLALALNYDNGAITALMHDGTRAVLEMPGDLLARVVEECLSQAGGGAQ